MTVLILSPRFTADTQAIWRAAIHAGWEFERLADWRAPKHLAGEDVVLYGEPLFAAVVADALGIALLETPPNWLTELSPAFTWRWVRAATLQDARELKTSAFIKPADDKCFAAGVYSAGPDASTELEETTPVLIAEPVHWEAEYRCFVLERQVAALSAYLREGNLVSGYGPGWQGADSELDDAARFADLVLHDERIRLPPAVVLDVGIIRGRGWAVVEANAAWGSGIYGCEPDAVLNVLQRSCVRNDRLSASDAEWVLNRPKSRETQDR